MARSHIEDAHQVALVNWSKCTHFIGPDTVQRKIHDVLFAIPNGGKRNEKEAARFKKQGVKAGVSDLFLPVPKNGVSGLWVELKKPIVKGERKPTTYESQKEWKELMIAMGYKAVICFGWDEAREAIIEYLGDSFVKRW